MITDKSTEFGTVPIWHPSEEAGKLMNKLVRGETSAVESLEQVIDKMEEPTEKRRVQSMLNDHRGFLSYFKTMAVKQGETPESDSGPWGTFVEFFVATAKLFGNKAALKALKEGHEHGLEQYKMLLDSEEVPSEAKSTLRTKIIPSVQGHITSIEEMESMQ